VKYCIQSTRKGNPTYSYNKKKERIGHILRRNCFLKLVIEGNIEGRMKCREDEEDVISY
jgi:hypothetical protein